MSEIDGLNWDLYPKYDQIVINSKLSTQIFAFESEIAELVYGNLIPFLKSNNYDIDESEDEIKRATISIQNTQFGIIEPAYSWLIVRSDDRLHRIVTDFIYKKYEEEIRSSGIIEHTENTRILKKRKYRIRFRSGNHESSDDLTPYTFFELYHNDQLLAKAILKYYNGEMNEFEPTILLIEVQEDSRGQGIGEYFLRFIECQLSKWGFYSIWSSDTKSMGFWKKMGYDIDIDEGLKGLDPLDCDEDM